MVSGVELIVGVREDPQFGPFMLVGLGGVMAELMRDAGFAEIEVREDLAGIERVVIGAR